MSAPQDSAGRPIAIGDTVMWRGEFYTIRAFGEAVGRCGTRTIEFEEPLHIEGEVPDEIAVDLVASQTRCCAEGCDEPLKHPALPFCPEHMKDEALIRAWEEL